jgi:hypothetical protein
VLDLDVGAHLAQALEMEIDRPGADGTPARQGDARAPVPGQQRPEHQHRGPHRLDQIVGRLERADTFHAHRSGLVTHDGGVGPQLFENPHHRPHVADAGQVVELDGLRRQQASGQRGQRRVLGSAYLETAA